MVINLVLERVFNGSNTLEVVSKCLFGPTLHVIDTYIYIYKYLFICVFSWLFLFFQFWFWKKRIVLIYIFLGRSYIWLKDHMLTTGSKGHACCWKASGDSFAAFQSRVSLSMSGEDRQATESLVISCQPFWLQDPYRSKWEAGYVWTDPHLCYWWLLGQNSGIFIVCQSRTALRSIIMSSSQLKLDLAISCECKNHNFTLKPSNQTCLFHFSTCPDRVWSLGSGASWPGKRMGANAFCSRTTWAFAI